MPSEVWNSSLIFHQLSQTCSQTFPTRVHTLVPDSKELHRRHKCGSVRRTSAGGKRGLGEDSFLFVWFGFPLPPSPLVCLFFLVKTHGIYRWVNRASPARVEGTYRAEHLESPAPSEASSGKTAFRIHGCFLRKGGKGTREERKGAGTLFVSVSNMVSFDFSFSIVKGSPGTLICYRLGCTCLPV